MSSPSPRQQAGYLRRLLFRGEIEVIDPATGRAAPVVVELHADVIRLLPMLESPKVAVAVDELPFDDDTAAWTELAVRLRRAVSLAQAEELVSAVETEVGRAGTIDPPV
ncbi:MAG TPA: hypothetical protein VMR31_14670 [Myxococcota bacterium]|nr:hypothetical protein [Myxococcota bacterium]